MKFIVTIFLSLSISSALQAAGEQIDVYARAFHNGCSYYTNTSTDFDVTIHAETLPWGTTVTLVSGFGGAEVFGSGELRNLSWIGREETKMEAIAGSTWQARRSAIVKTRSSAWNFTSLEFVFKMSS